MDLRPTDEQREIVELFETVADRTGSLVSLREHEPLGFAPALWEQLIAIGAPGMGLPTGAGGGGSSILDLALAAEALGGRLAPAPFVEHAVAGRLLARHGHADAAIMDGREIATLSLRPADAANVARLVPAGAVATHVVALDGAELVVARTEPPGTVAPNLAAAPLADRPLAVGVDDRIVLASGADARAAHEAALDEWRALTAAALVGLATGALNLGRDYVAEREQFGVPIGSFQAIQHSLADVSVAIDGAQLLTRKAAWALDVGRADAGELSGSAFLFAAEEAQRATERVLHFHGGYGFMQEYDIQLYYRRAKGWPLVLGPPAREYARLAVLRYGPIPEPLAG